MYGKLLYNAPPLLKEKLPRLPRPAVANHRVPMPDTTHRAPGLPVLRTPILSIEKDSVTWNVVVPGHSDNDI